MIKQVKSVSRLKKIGHSGTLDKFASGLLVICTGMATKLTRFFLSDDKAYTGIVKLGIQTDTDDTGGEIIEERTADHITSTDIIREVEHFRGEITQVPPQYSALKIKGRRASDRARAGEQVDMKVRKVTVHDLAVRNFDRDNGTVTIDVVCSKGTYIRSIARDLGGRLGTGACLQGLRRTRSGRFSVNDAVDIRGLQGYLQGAGENTGFCLTPLEALEHFNSVTVGDDTASRVKDGAFFSMDEVISMNRSGDEFCTVIDEKKNLIAIARIDFDNWNVRYCNVFNRSNGLA